MFTSLSSYIWGGNTNNAPEAAAPESRPPPRDPSPDDWVLVGGGHPAPGNLNTSVLEPLRPTSSLGSSPVSSAASVVDDNDNSEEVSPAAQLPSVARLPSPPVRSHQDLALVAEQRAVRASQGAKQRAAGKALSSKALKRANMAAAVGGQHRHGKAAIRQTSLPFKMAGSNKNLKQC